MRKISIVGAGQFGLHLGIALRQAGYDVTIVTNRTAQQISDGRVTSSQILFRPVLEMEDALGLNRWAGKEGVGTGYHVTITDGQGGKLFGFGDAVDGGMGQSVDQRLKFPYWMHLFEQAGGELVVADVGVPELEDLASTSDLVIVAAGKGEVSGLFERDSRLSKYDRAQRHVMMAYVHGLKPDEHGSSTIRFVQIPGVGEWVNFPGVTHSGACDMLLFVSRFDGPIYELTSNAGSGAEVLAAGHEYLRRYAPWEAERCADMRLTDELGWLAGAVTPTVRRPFAHLPSGRAIMGGGDTVVLNDPIVGQGANNASKHADVVLKAILAHGDKPFDEEFMQRTFDAHWEKAQWVAQFCNTMLDPPPHVGAVLHAAVSSQPIRDTFQRGFGDASVLADWFFDEEAAMKKVQSVTAPTAAG